MMLLNHADFAEADSTTDPRKCTAGYHKPLAMPSWYVMPAAKVEVEVWILTSVTSFARWLYYPIAKHVAQYSNGMDFPLTLLQI